MKSVPPSSAGTPSWDEAICPGCKTLLRLWADTLRGCCGRCRHPFPPEFQFVHEAAVLKRAQEAEWMAGRVRQGEEQQRQEWRARSSVALQKLIQEQSGRTVSRLELIALLRQTSRETWNRCREGVDVFLAENPVETRQKDIERLRQIVRQIG